MRCEVIHGFPTSVTIATILCFIPAYGEEKEWNNINKGITHFVRLVNCEVAVPYNSTSKLSKSKSFDSCPRPFEYINLYWMIGLILGGCGTITAWLYFGIDVCAKSWQPWQSEATGRYTNEFICCILILIIL